MTFSKALRAELARLPDLKKRLAAGNLTIVVSLSGGLDSVACLLLARLLFPNARLIAHHQALYEDWATTIPYCRALCARFGIPLFVHQGIYTYGQRPGGRTGNTMHLTPIPPDRNEPYSREEAAELLKVDPAMVQAGVLDMAEHRGAPPTAGIRFCTAYFKREVYNAWVRQNRQMLGANVVTMIGYRRLESSKRAKEPVGQLRPISLKPCKEWPDGWQTWDFHPVLDWTKQQTYDFLDAHNVTPHVSYTEQGIDFSRPLSEGMPRHSCVQCIFSRGCAVASAVRGTGKNPTDTAHARKIVERTLRFQQTTGLSWQQGGPAELDKAAVALETL